MKVKLLTGTLSPMRVLWTAARTCQSDDEPKGIFNKFYKLEGPLPEDVLRLLRNCWSAGHHSIFEHVTFTYAVAGVSRTLLGQYSRHRIGVSLSVQSQRAGKFGGFVMPESFTKAKEVKESQYSPFDTLEERILAHIEESELLYGTLREIEIPKEDARFVLPGGQSLNFVTTVNLRSLADLWQKRVVAPGAQWEIRQMIQAMVAEANGAMPWLSEIGWCEEAGQ